MVENGRNNLDCCVVRDLLPAYLEGLTEEEIEEGKDYFSVMRENLQALVKALQ